MESDAVDDMSPLPTYLQDMLSSLPNDHGVALSSPDGPSVASIGRLEDRRRKLAYLLLARHRLTQCLAESPGPSPELILRRAEVYDALGYNELALADAYVSYTLCLVALDGPDVSDLVPVGPNGESWPVVGDDELSAPRALRVATRHKYLSLVMLLRSAIELGSQSHAKLWMQEIMEVSRELHRFDGDNEPFEDAKIEDEVMDEVRKHSEVFPDSFDEFETCVRLVKAKDLKPTLFSWCQRQIYPWNEHEPDRMSKDSLAEINEKLHEVAPDLVVEISELPTLAPSLERGVQRLSVGETHEAATTKAASSSQLGLFAKKQLAPGTTVLRERTVLTGIRPHDEALCDACAADMERVALEDRRYCPGCDIPFCSTDCQSAALERYHCPNEDDSETDNGYPPPESPFCAGSSGNDDIQNLGRAESSTTPEWDLYFLLLARTFQMAETQGTHPLDLFEIKYLWGDFSPTPQVLDLPVAIGPKTLPYSVRHHVELPLQWFETLMQSCDRCRPYSADWLKKYDWWIIQTLFAKVRGVADAAQSTWTGQAEVAAVQPLWCLANHSCNPNVTWSPFGVRNLTVVKQKAWYNPDVLPSAPWEGIRAGEEIWNHYTDIQEKDHHERQERLHKVLGGDCSCERCMYESKQRKSDSTHQRSAVCTGTR